ncbi:MAG: redoxin domain-containing protein [Akkermansiaceae bacterium]|nr:redoxin domain-containing protein [Akkermansiaceae bacterium]
MIRLQTILLALLPAILIAADDAPRPGHSHRGEAFNEGPRTGAVLMEGTGARPFPVTTDSDEAQAFIDQGVGQLHGFWYFEAERSFRQAAAADPDCAMAYWGMAMANWENEKRAKLFIKEAVARKDGAGPRERLYIAARANHLDDEPKEAKKRHQELLNDLETIIHEHPDDLEARAFLACRIWQFSRKGLPIHSHEAVDALLAPVFAAHPMHPAHHYRIHLWDKHKAERALDSAAKLGRTAPAIAHMWHMPGHIYSQLKRYDDSAWAQQASARIDHRHMIANRLLPDQIFNYAHNNEWLVRNFIIMGDAPRALAAAKSLVSNPRHPKHNTLEKNGRSARYGFIRLLEVIEQFELWDEADVCGAAPWLAPGGPPELEAKRLRVLGIAHARRENPSKLKEITAELDTLLATAKEARESAAKEAREKAEGEKKKPKEIEDAVKAAVKKPEAAVKALKSAREELDLYRALLDNDLDAAKELAGKASGEKFARARLHLHLGDSEKALAESREAVEKKPGQVLPLAARVEILNALGMDEEAREAFGQLRELSAHLDLNAPPFLRLTPVAVACGFADDWRVAPAVRDDVGTRPDLGALGPAEWSPPPAPPFERPDHDGTPVALKDFKGEALVLIFYLGHGCLHCVDQLNAFAREAARFESAGLRILAVSTDSVPEIRKSRDGFATDGGEFPFPLLADPGLRLFQRYHAYDDFEKEPLHATFVLDPAGRILWRDIGAEPFEDTGFVLDEARRLLILHGNRP